MAGLNHECWGDGTTDLTHEGMLELVLAPNVLQLIRVFVLGHIINTGTALLLDEQNNGWFYRTPNSVDGQLCGFSPQAAMVMQRGYHEGRYRSHSATRV